MPEIELKILTDLCERKTERLVNGRIGKGHCSRFPKI